MCGLARASKWFVYWVFCKDETWEVDIVLQDGVHSFQVDHPAYAPKYFLVCFHIVSLMTRSLVSFHVSPAHPIDFTWWWCRRQKEEFSRLYVSFTITKSWLNGLIFTIQSNNQARLPFKVFCQWTFIMAIYVEKINFWSHRELFFCYSTVVGHWHKLVARLSCHAVSSSFNTSVMFTCPWREIPSS